MTQPETTTWSGAVQRELDALSRSVDTRFTDFANRLDRLLTLTEYYADKRSADIRFENLNEKIEDSETNIDELKLELRTSLESLRRDIQAERERYEKAIQKETTDRQTQHTGYLKARQDQFRWVLSMLVIPIVIAAVGLIVKK